MGKEYKFEDEEERKEIHDVVISHYGNKSGNINRERMNRDLDETQKFFYRFHFLSVAFPLIVGVALFVVGCISCFDRINNKKRCTELVKGEVVDFTLYESLDRDAPSDSYAPVFRYTYQGTEYTHKGKSYSGKENLFVGKKVDIYVDPFDPSNIYVPEYKVEKKAGIGLVIVGAIVILVSVLYPIYASKKARKEIQSAFESSL